ncbi:hypothetical protein [Cupriavidus pauculus]|uniref:hypothetical protein n=1 Tax=Cupriavidus pauculus TaxID=82633 RepID=UPI001246C60C|nr:hypothetical protein [Cupriavidus pauculus]KAB0599113.1 hypothetical protein F7R19_24730 [Cupriavidus pauculus]
MTALSIALIGAAAFVCALTWWLHRSSRLEAVRSDEQFVYVGRGRRKAKKLAWKDITEISIAPLYDVAPADDCWLLRGKSTDSVGFLGREIGAAVVLARLESVLPGFDVASSIRHAHANAAFEEPILVWRAASRP